MRFNLKEMLTLGILIEQSLLAKAAEVIKEHKPTAKQLAAQKRRRHLTADVMEALRKQEKR